ncbi:hypothetical protein AB0469_21450 [Streptomyces sp. NPDC093801]|uniref:hypothetical protein n=1 Tax=Streptomyces sp. NPDC093801 TaxID=3155203 RepID=UPI0034502447
MSKFKRVMGLAAATAIAGALPVLAAAPAQAAGTNSCAAVVGSQGYTVGPKVGAACSNGAVVIGAGLSIPNPLCVTGLVNIGVDYSTAQWACQNA